MTNKIYTILVQTLLIKMSLNRENNLLNYLGPKSNIKMLNLKTKKFNTISNINQAALNFNQNNNTSNGSIMKLQTAKKIVKSVIAQLTNKSVNEVSLNSYINNQSKLTTLVGKLNKGQNRASDYTNDYKEIFYLALFRMLQELPITNRGFLQTWVFSKLMNTKYKVLILRMYNVNTKNGTAGPYLLNLSTMKMILGIPHTTKLDSISTNNLYNYAITPYLNQTRYKANYNAARYTLATYLKNKSTNLTATKMSNVNIVKRETYNYLRNTPYKHYLTNE